MPAGAVRTDTGTFAGSTSGGVESFLGIPFAAPPVGALRFFPPQPVASIAPGITQATSFKPTCYSKPGATGAITFDSSPVGSSEDCLYLNVWAPSDLQPSKPVDVWIYGGAYISGEANVYNGTTYAQQGIVYVNFDYREGIFGFFAHPGLDAILPQHTSGNQAILDDIAVLKWVQRNIAKFGGDPANVTIHGESAGGGSVEALIASPLAKGLFKRAISESAFIGQHPQYTTAGAEQYFAANTPGYSTSLATMQNIDANTLNNDQPTNIFDNGTSTPFAASQYAPIVDGYVFPQTERALFASGNFNHADLLVGNCDNEGYLFTNTSYTTDATPATFQTYLAQTYPGSYTSQAMALYPVTGISDSMTQLGQLYADPIFNIDSRTMARDERNAGQNVWQYVYTRPEPAQSGPDTHICEIPFVYPGLAPVTNPQFNADTGAQAQEALVVDAWSRFMKTGNPNGGMVTTWPRFDSGENYLEFSSAGPAVRVMPYRQPQLDLVDSYLNSLPAGALPSFTRRR